MLKECILAVVVAIILVLAYLNAIGKIDSATALSLGTIVAVGGGIAYAMSDGRIIGGAFTPDQRQEKEKALKKLRERFNKLVVDTRYMYIQMCDMQDELDIDECETLLKGLIEVKQNPTFADLVYVYEKYAETYNSIGYTISNPPYNKETQEVYLLERRPGETVDYYRTRAKGAKETLGKFVHLPTDSLYKRSLKTQYAVFLKRLSRERKNIKK